MIMNFRDVQRVWSAGYVPALVSGMLLGVSFPSYPFIRLEVLAWIALVPLLLASRNEREFRRFFLQVYLAMLVFCSVSIWWISLATLGGGLLTIVAQALFLAVPLLLFFLLMSLRGWRFALYALPFLWVGWEWAYIQQDLSFGWLTLGNSQALLTPMIQYADITGVWGISFWVVLFNVLVADLLAPGTGRSRQAALAVALAVMVTGSLLHGWMVLRQDDGHAAGRSVSICVVQPNIDPFSKWTRYNSWDLLDIPMRMTDAAVAQSRPDLVLWPETAIPFHILDERFRAYLDVLRDRQEQWGAGLLSGFSHIEYTDPADIPGGRTGMYRYDERSGKYTMTYNASLFLSEPDAEPFVYRKMKLVPFAERVPFVEYFPWLERFTLSLAGIRSWGKGAEYTMMPLTTGSGETVRFMNMICYESIFPGLVAGFVQRGAEFLTLVTNDGWYAKSYGPYQHAAIGRLRCIENRRAMARCANTGLSMFIDRYGRSTADIEWWSRRTLTANLDCETPLTFYTRCPRLVPLLCLGVGAGAVLFAFLFRFRQQT